jgi:hypothetical protein
MTEPTFVAWFLTYFGITLLFVAVALAARWLSKRLTGD